MRPSQCGTFVDAALPVMVGLKHELVIYAISSGRAVRLKRQLTTGSPACSCRYERSPRVHHGINKPLYVWDCWCRRKVFVIDPACVHHGDARTATVTA